jgi:hypothetical protein
MRACLTLRGVAFLWSKFSSSLPFTTTDPAAEEFDYPVSFDVRDLVTLEDVMEELELGPNG